MNLDDLAPERVRPLSRVEYDRLVDLGAFGDERIELLYGALVEMSPQNPAHAYVIRQLAALLQTSLNGRAQVQVQLPLVLRDDSEPEPDVAVVPLADYSHEHPTSALLVVEVADSSLRKDRAIKGRLYAEAGVPEYWVVNLVDGVVERHTRPEKGAYSVLDRVSGGSEIRLSVFPDVAISLSRILPRPS